MISRELPYARYDPSHCLNCDRDLGSASHFCPNCGQRNRESRKPLVQWIGEGLSTFLHLEGKTVTTLRDLPVPGRMVRNYLNGKRDRYIHPLRLLLLSSLLCFAVVRLTSGGEEVVTDAGDFSEGFVEGASSSKKSQARLKADFNEALEDVASGEEAKFDADGESYDTAQLRILIDSVRREATAAVDGNAIEVMVLAQVDSIELQVERAVRKYDGSNVFGLQADKNMTDPMRSIDRLRMGYANHDRVTALTAFAKTRYAGDDSLALALLDSIAAAFPEPSGTNLPDTFLYGEPTGLDNRQYAAMTPEQLVHASTLKSRINRLALAKMAQINQEGQQSINEALMANVTWMVLLFMPMLAFGYWLLWWRRLPYYSQHLNLVAITLSVALLLGAVALLAKVAGVPESVAYPGALVTFIGYVFATEMRVFEVVWWKVLLKSFVLGFFGMIALVVAILLWIALTLLFN